LPKKLLMGYTSYPINQQRGNFMARPKKVQNVEKVEAEKKQEPINFKNELDSLNAQRSILEKQIDELSMNLEKCKQMHLRCSGAIQLVEKLINISTKKVANKK